MVDPNAECFALGETEQSLDFMRDSAYLVSACTWELAERPVTTINTPAAVAETILTAMKDKNKAYSIVAKVSVNETRKERAGAYQHVGKRLSSLECNCHI